MPRTAYSDSTRYFKIRFNWSYHSHQTLLTGYCKNLVITIPHLKQLLQIPLWKYYYQPHLSNYCQYHSGNITSSHTSILYITLFGLYIYRHCIHHVLIQEIPDEMATGAGPLAPFGSRFSTVEPVINSRTLWFCFVKFLRTNCLGIDVTPWMEHASPYILPISRSRGSR